MSETLGALLKYLVAILAVVAMVAVAYAIQKSSKETDASADLARLVYKIQTMYGGQVGSSTISLAELQQAGFMPEGWAAGTTQWGGSVTVAAEPGGFMIELKAVPDSACEKLLLTAPPGIASAPNPSQADALCAGNLANNGGGVDLHYH